MTRVAHITDSHLSGDRAYFFDNFEILREELKAFGPALVINTGDLTIDGVAREEDLRFALACHERLGFPWRAVPGNHDVGEEPGGSHLDQPITAETLRQYRAAFGPDWWAHAIPGWRLLGFNTQILGAELPDEAAQWAWLADQAAMARAQNEAIALFLHKPLWGSGPEEGPDPVWHVTPERRRRLLGTLGGSLKLVCSGHLHQGWVRDFDGVTHVWGPSCGFPSKEARGPGAMTAVGFVALDLAADGGFTAALRQPATFVPHDYHAVKAGAPYLKDGPLHPAPIVW